MSFKIRSALDGNLLKAILDDANAVFDRLGAPGGTFAQRWHALASNDRKLCGLLYDAVKSLPSVMAAAASCAAFPEIKERVASPSIIDINLRLDAYGESQYAFDWHQDFWFLMAARRTQVVWIPLIDLDGTNGGIEVCDRVKTSCPYGTLPCKPPGGVYTSYASSLVLDGAVEEFCDPADVTRVDSLAAGSAVVFDFLSLHRSLPVPQAGGLRFTLQVRISDFQDDEFRAAGFRKCVHNRERMTYLDHMTEERLWNGTF